MPRLNNSNPRYRRHRGSGQAVVSIDGRDFYLGPWGTKASKSEYDRLIGEWLAGGRRLTVTGGNADITVTEVIDRFWAHAQLHYRHLDGTPTSEQGVFQLVLKILKRLYGHTRARDFGPLALEACRQEMVNGGWVRKSINNQAARIRAVFKWATAKELISPSVHHGLTAVAGLRAGRTAAKESDPVRPVPDDLVDTTLQYLSRTVGAMVQLQRLTGARPGEICMIRTGDIDRSRDVWLYTPIEHKNTHHGHTRLIYIGKRGQEVLRPFLRLNPDAYCFSPSDAERERREEMHAQRTTPLSYGNKPGSNRQRKPRRVPGNVYDVASYRRAIARAADLADNWAKGGLVIGDDERIIPRWHPHQLRHTAATEIRKRFGIEAAQSVLGHATLSMTELYAEKNAEAAQKIAAAIG